MALNIKDPEVDKLAAELAARLNMSKTGAIRVALRSQLAHLESRSEDRARAALEMMETEIWPLTRGVEPITKDERERILGYGEDGV